jgi:hypothetical protein
MVSWKIAQATQNKQRNLQNITIRKLKKKILTITTVERANY